MECQKDVDHLLSRIPSIKNFSWDLPNGPLSNLRSSYYHTQGLVGPTWQILGDPFDTHLFLPG